ncbi:lysine--tRNA ligase [uncultured Exiguobacterium sp.]|uniref:lysine--tRNA ligase n=1 Tax=uncultured Exiguobacterium sp. TaxID=202669 RepID=UPI0025DD4670|nr:lysine--tRNA ligase [uncultured Exiguobacterium sp.]
MHWAEHTARTIIERQPGKETYVCAAGISPSGPVHIGNFREVVTTYFVARALQDLGKDVRFLFSWDDYDRFRKVPVDVDQGFTRYIGIPYSAVPAPDGSDMSYATYFEQQFETMLKAFEIRPDYRYQHEAYTSGTYAEQIIHAFRHRHAIYDILIEHKTAAGSDAERAAYYPATVYCVACGTDATTIDTFDEDEVTYHYSCRCGHTATVDMRTEHRMKLNWKVDWAMRWAHEGVDFEPGGKDHSAANGSYTVSSRIAQEIFQQPAPLYLPYEFIRLKGDSKKMSSSSGGVLTPKDLLAVYPPSILLFLFAKHRPNHAFHIGIDEDVLRNYSEFERFVAHSSRQSEDIQQSLRWSHHATAHPVSFTQLTMIGPMVGFEPDLIENVFCVSVPTEQIARARTFVTQWCPDRELQVSSVPNHELHAHLTETEQNWIQQFVVALRTNEDILAAFYRLTRQAEKKETLRLQKHYATILYQLTINQSYGPRIPLLVTTIGRKRMSVLLDFTNEEIMTSRKSRDRA